MRSMIAKRLPKPCHISLLAASLCFFSAMHAKAEDPNPSDLSKWNITGAVTLDPTKVHAEGGAGSIKVEPGSKAILHLGDEPRAGRVTMWVYDDGVTRGDAKVKHLGPRWGVMQPDKIALGGGLIFASYLDGNKYYSLIESDGKTWTTPYYMGNPKRSKCWTQWVFNFNPDEGINVAADGQISKAFQPAKAKFHAGILDIVLVGDETAAGGNMTLWVDEIKVELGKPLPMPAASKPDKNAPKRAPLGASTAAPLVMEGFDADAPAFVHAPGGAASRVEAATKVNLPPVVPPGEHPRLLFSAKEVAELKAKLEKTERGKATLEAFMDLANGAAKGNPTFPTVEATVANKAGKEHAALSKHAQEAGFAYALTGDRKYAKAAREILMGYADRYEGYPRHSGRNKSDSSKIEFQRLSEAMWLIPLLESYDYIYNSDVLSAEDRAHIEKDLIRACIFEIQRKEPAKEAAARDQKEPGWRTAEHEVVARAKKYPNWINFYSSATMMAGAIMNDKDMMDIAASDFRSAIATGIGSDGMWGEGAIGYQFFAMGVMSPGFETAARQGINLWGANGGRFKMLFDSPLRYAYPDGTMPGIHDSGRARLGSWQTMVYDYGYLRYGVDSYAFLVNNSPRQLHTSDGVYEPTQVYDTLPEPASSKMGSVLFESLGYCVLRDDLKYTLVDYGPHGDTHGHYDKLNLILFASPPGAKGDEMGGEPRFYPYDNPLHDQWTVHTIAHNTMAVDETSQVACTGKLLVLEDTPELKVMRAEASQAYPGVLLDRTVVVAKDVVVDVYQGTSAANHTWDRTFRYQGALDAMSKASEATQGLGVGSGYQHIKVAARQPATEQWQGSWASKVGAFNVNIAGTEGQELIMGVGPEKEHIVVVREKGMHSQVAAAYQLALWGNPVSSVKWLPGAKNVLVCEVQQGEGKKMLVFVGDGTPWEAAGWKSDSRVLVVQDDKGSQRVLIGGGTTASDGKGEVKLESAGNALAEGNAGALKMLSSWKPEVVAETPSTKEPKKTETKKKEAKKSEPKKKKTPAAETATPTPAPETATPASEKAEPNPG